MPVELPTSFFSEKTSEVVREVAADAPTILGIGLETITGMALGGGGIALGIGAFKLVRRLLQKNRKDGGETRAADPFPRRLDEARQHRELRQFTERRCPEFDAAVGRVIQDELDLSQQLGTKEDNATLTTFWERVRRRVDRLMPPSTREYITTKGH